MSPGDLITLANIRDWLNTGSLPLPTSSDALLARLVSSVSLFAKSYLQRDLKPANYTEVRNGGDTRQMFVRNRPIISVSSLTIYTTVIAARTTVGGAGYAFDDSSIYLDACGGYGNGYSQFPRGVQNISIAYRAGLQTSDPVSVPSPVASVSVTTLSRPWNSDQGVTYANGTPLTLVTVSPTVAGTYQVKADTGGTAEYVFATGDAGAGVVISYGYTPEDVVQALVELAGERFKSRGRIGETSQIGGHGITVAFSQKDMGPAIKMLLSSYRNVVPVL